MDRVRTSIQFPGQMLKPIIVPQPVISTQIFISIVKICPSMQKQTKKLLSY